MLSNANLGLKLVILQHLINKFLLTSIECMTPKEKWSDSPTKYTNLKAFRCPAYAHMRQGKLEPRARKCIFLSYADKVKGYKLWYSDSNSSKLPISRDVSFNESTLFKE